MLASEEYKDILIRMWDENRADDVKGSCRCDGVQCEDCILSNLCPYVNEICDIDSIFEALSLIEQWGKEHPVKTNMDKFEEIFGFRPNVFLRGEVVAICNGYHKLDDTFWNAEYKKEEVSEQVSKGKKKQHMEATDIEWRTDGEQVDLPKTVEIPDDIEEEDIVDWLSDTYGWDVSCFVLERKAKDTGKIDAMTY